MRAVDATLVDTAPVDPFLFDATLFKPKRPATAWDWLSTHPEPGQSFADYLRGIPMVGTPTRTVLVFQPLGHFTPAERALLDILADFARCFYQRPVRIQPPLPLPAKGQRWTTAGPHRHRQHLTTVLLAETLLPRLPDDALGFVGVTMADLYPDPAWNYVFGEASFRQRVGVYSLLRYTAAFEGRRDTQETRQLFLRRAMKVLVHEIGHLFSLRHCIESECLMNGSNHLEELDGNRIQLCPECLRKLHWNLEFDIPKRYAELRAFFQAKGFPDWAAWMDARLRQLGH